MRKNNKRALILSCLSLLLCVSMLIGSTFAWFTDNDTTAVANIVSGTLDIEIVDADGKIKEDALKFVDKNFNSDIKWEPGATFHTEQFAFKNNGNLYLKLKVEINNTEVSYNKLNEAISFSLVDAVTGDKIALNAATVQDFPVAPGMVTGYYRIEGTMDQNAGNEYQGLTMEGVSITVYATQYASEYDSNGNDYDAEAAYDGEVVTVGTADEFIAAFANLEVGQTITLTADIDMTGKNWTPVNNKGFTLTGNGKTVTGLGNGLVGHTGSGEFVIKNITFDKMAATDTYKNATYSYAGLIGDADTCSYILMDTVTISNSTIKSTTPEEGYAAGFVAYTSGYGNDNDGAVNDSHNFTNCKLVNTTVNGTSSAGGLIGHCGGNDATTTNIKDFFIDDSSTVKGEKNAKDGKIIGTANIGVIYLDKVNNLSEDIGRFVPGTTGKLVINSVEQQAFANN